MGKAGGGSIVNISSLASVQGVLGVHAYTCAKGALNAVTRQMAVDYAHLGVRSNCIVVGLVATEPLLAIFSTYPQIEEKVAEATLTRIGQPEDVAEAAIYLASDAAAYVTGALLPVDGGLTCKGHLPDIGKMIADLASQEPAASLA
jgi:NAD(P)-dependent dehydrogenase (short-subunit alcohol dehydrogenase family)